MIERLKKIWKSKTMLFSFALAILSAVQLSLGLFTSVLSPQAFAWITMVIAIIVAALRWVTTTDLSQK